VNNAEQIWEDIWWQVYRRPSSAEGRMHSQIVEALEQAVEERVRDGIKEWHEYAEAGVYLQVQWQAADYAQEKEAS